MFIRDVIALLQGGLEPIIQAQLFARVVGLLFVISFCLAVHEFAHAFAAKKLGDNTAYNHGRLTLNPIKHFDPIGTTMILLAGFGYAKPVPVNPRNLEYRRFKHRGQQKCMAIIAAAGPVSNFVVAAMFWGLTQLARQLWIGSLFAGGEIVDPNLWFVMFYVFSQTVMSLNIGLGIFNLLPIPPLDGSRILDLFLPLRASLWMSRNEQIFRWGLMGLLALLALLSWL